MRKVKHLLTMDTNMCQSLSDLPKHTAERAAYGGFFIVKRKEMM